MPPGINHPNYVSWDDLDVWSQAKLIEYLRIRAFDESGGDKKPKKPTPPRRLQR